MSTPTYEFSLVDALAGPIMDPKVRALSQVKVEGYTGLTGTGLTLKNHIIAGQQDVFKNGVFLHYPTDYTVSGSTVTFAVALVSGDKIHIRYLFRTS